jgi:hypothetical protein
MSDAMTPDLTDDELRAIEDRAAKATPGPWTVSFDPNRPNHGWVYDADNDCLAGDLEPGDAAFIAAARTDVPRLVAALRAEREARASADGQIRLIFSKEFRAELLERTVECDTLRAKVRGIEKERDVERARAAYWKACAEQTEAGTGGRHICGKSPIKLWQGMRWEYCADCRTVGDVRVVEALDALRKLGVEP